MSVVLSANEAADAPEEIREKTILGLTSDGWLRILAPALIGFLALAGWEWAVRAKEIPSYILPGPVEIGRTLLTDWGTLSGSLLITLQITFAALFVAAVLGLALAVLFAQSRIIELSLFPYAVILQVTPIVAIAPLIFIWVDDIRIALLICAWIVAFFPILSNTLIGLRAADPGLKDLFRLYQASPWQRLRWLLVPTALPYFISGLKISGGLALIGAVVAEFAAGAAGRETGLASRILEASFRTEIPKMYAALLLIALTGVAIFLLLDLLARALLGRRYPASGHQEP